jgi:hypothetical protein
LSEDQSFTITSFNTVEWLDSENERYGKIYVSLSLYFYFKPSEILPQPVATQVLFTFILERLLGVGRVGRHKGLI